MSDNEKRPKSSQKYKHADAHSVSQYNRRQILKVLAEKGGGPEAWSQILKQYPKLDRGELAEFMEKRAKIYQEKVGEEANTTKFHTIDKWLQYFKKRGMHSDCGFELPLVLRTIAKTEKFQESGTEDDVEFEKLYLWLAEVMQGNAPPELNTQSQLFLMENFTNLVNMTNTLEDECELTEIALSICENSPVDHTACDEVSRSLDPLRLLAKKQ